MTVHETQVTTRQAVLVIVGAPTTWMVHFMTVYLVAEAACELGGGDRWIVPFTVAATIVAAIGICVILLRVAHLRALIIDHHHTFHSLTLAGLLLGGLSLIGVIAVGTPAVMLGPC